MKATRQLHEMGQSLWLDSSYVTSWHELLQCIASKSPALKNAG